MTVTVAIPFHSEPLAEFQLAVRSVFAQTTDDWQLILIGDCARADLVNAALTIEDARVRVENGNENRGLACRLNQAARWTSTKYLARMDADDVMMPSRLADQLAFLNANPETDLLGARAIAIDEKDRIMGLFRERPLPATTAGFLASNGFTHPTVIGRTEWFRKNTYNESIRRAEDKELWLRSHPTSRFAKLDSQAVLFYRIPSGFNRAKSVRTCADDRKVTLPYARTLAGRQGELKYAAVSVAKQMTYQAAGQLVWPRISQSRYEALDLSGLSLAERALESVRSTTVPGWEGR